MKINFSPPSEAPEEFRALNFVAPPAAKGQGRPALLASAIYSQGTVVVHAVYAMYAMCWVCSVCYVLGMQRMLCVGYAMYAMCCSANDSICAASCWCSVVLWCVHEVYSSLLSLHCPLSIASCTHAFRKACLHGRCSWLYTGARCSISMRSRSLVSVAVRH